MLHRLKAGCDPSPHRVRAHRCHCRLARARHPIRRHQHNYLHRSRDQDQGPEY